MKKIFIWVLKIMEKTIPFEFVNHLALIQCFISYTRRENMSISIIHYNLSIASHGEKKHILHVVNM